MNTHADKTQENRNQSIVNEVSEIQSSSESVIQFVDNRSEAIAQRKMQEVANNSSQVKYLSGFQEMANNSPQGKQAAQLQVIADNYSGQEQQPIQKKENKTGLPDNLKTGVENLSGYSMDDVKVHYNSDKPAQLSAHAYAQGTDIHLAPGQEKHLPHEAWHVVQQKQGRVKPSMQMKGHPDPLGLNINDDSGLEKEADLMGTKAGQIGSLLSSIACQLTQKVPLAQTSPDAFIVQRVISNSATYVPSAAATGFITALNALVAAAENLARDYVDGTTAPLGGVHTPTQAAYMVNPSAALWGSCVEEQLNLTAPAAWTQQYSGLVGAVPDYHMTLASGRQLFVDLTTAGQAGIGGNHITGKLQTAAANEMVPPVNWEAADITHAGLNPLAGAAAVPAYNGNVTALQMARLQAYNAYCNDEDAEYDEDKQNMSDAYDGAIHHAAFTQIWTAAERQTFAQDARLAGYP